MYKTSTFFAHLSLRRNDGYSCSSQPLSVFLSSKHKARRHTHWRYAYKPGLIVKLASKPGRILQYSSSALGPGWAEKVFTATLFHSSRDESCHVNAVLFRPGLSHPGPGWNPPCKRPLSVTVSQLARSHFYRFSSGRGPDSLWGCAGLRKMAVASVDDYVSTASTASRPTGSVRSTSTLQWNVTRLILAESLEGLSSNVQISCAAFAFKCRVTIVHCMLPAVERPLYG